MSNKESAIKIIRKLRAAGFEALLAGGCVRDMLLRKRAKDYDVATSAVPKQVMGMFKRTLKVGAKFGVVIVLDGDEQVEVATFRSEADYDDGRRPSHVEFCSAEEDAKRRDFTINGMFYDPVSRKVIDYVGGQKDLKKKLIRTIGDADERFGEDYLRLLRAVRFSTRLGFKIEPKTYKAICKKAAKINQISGERISMELEGILICPERAAGVELLIETSLAKKIFTGFGRKNAKVGVDVLSCFPKAINYPLGLAGLFAGYDTQYAMDKCKLLKLSRNQIRHIKFLLEKRGKLLDVNMSLAELRKIAAEPYFEDLCKFQRAIQRAIIGTNSSLTPIIKIKHRLKMLGDIELKPKPLLNGYELMKLGSVSGPVVGQLSNEMYIAQLEGQIETAEQARQWVRKWIYKHNEIKK